MRVAISDKTVRHNIELFKMVMRKQIGKKEKLIHVIKKSYLAFIHRITGEIRFAELDEEIIKGKDWKIISIRMRIPEHREEGFFEILEGENEEVQFDTKDLDPIAYRALAETIKTLNRLSFPTLKMKNVERIFQEISELEIESNAEKKGSRDLIHDAWHQLSRLEAETILNDYPVGTYLFRKDEFAALMEAELNAQHQDHHIKCVTLTYIEWDGKISEKTLVLKEQRWHFYDDNLDVRGYAYPSIESLLKTMDHILREPLFHG